MEERVRIEKKDGIADVRMVREDKMNAVDIDMFIALVEAGQELMDDRSLRAVVLSGQGRAFCAGLDIPSLMANTGKRDPDAPNLSDRTDPDSPANFAQRCAWIWQELPVPVIAAVHGVAYGAGFQIAMGADIRFVAPDARLSIRETYWGLIPDVGATQTMRNIVPLDVAKELTFTARVISGTDAKELGIATHVANEPHAAAMTLAEEISARSPDAVRAAKQLWNESVQGTVAEGLALEARLQGTLMGKPNQMEAVQAGMQKREPKFEDPKK